MGDWLRLTIGTKQSLKHGVSNSKPMSHICRALGRYEVGQACPARQLSRSLQTKLAIQQFEPINPSIASAVTLGTAILAPLMHTPKQPLADVSANCYDTNQTSTGRSGARSKAAH
jgi:hypothetical protein